MPVRGLWGPRAAALVLAAACLCSTAAAGTAPRGDDGGMRGLFLGGGSERGPITIDARRFEVDNKRRTATYIEQVVARQDDTTLTADRLVVAFDESRRISQVTAEGGVRIVQKVAEAPGAPPAEREATCAKAVFAVTLDRIVCTGAPASMRQGDDVIRGSRITVWVADERIVVEGDSASPRVTSRITPRPEATAGGRAGAAGQPGTAGRTREAAGQPGPQGQAGSTSQAGSARPTN
ncbi:MAG TPA: LptA/OstA family protein [Thermodesulfobacteriota bacterium]